MPPGLFEWAFGPRHPMKNWSSRIGGADPLVRAGRPRRPAGAPQDADVVVSAARPGGPPHQAPRVWFFDSVGMGVPPAKFHEKPGAARFVGADPPVRAGRPRPAAGPTVSASCRAPAGRRGRPTRTRGVPLPSRFFAPVHPSAAPTSSVGRASACLVRAQIGPLLLVLRPLRVPLPSSRFLLLSGNPPATH